MIPTLSDWFYSYDNLPAWVLAGGLILFWWIVLKIAKKFLIYREIRPARVVILTEQVLFLAGNLFIFDVAFVPIVLAAFHGLALVSLLICVCAALLYLFSVSDKDFTGQFDKMTRNSDPF